MEPSPRFVRACKTLWRYRLALLLTLSGCGGGGDTSYGAGGSETPLTPSSASTCGLANFQSAALSRVNQYRAAGASCLTAGTFAATTALRWNDALTQAAEQHSQDMKANNFFSHTGSGPSTLSQRINATGYAWTAIAENIAAGQATMSQVVDSWMGSAGHCANIMNPNLVDMGLVCVAGAASNTYTTYWTMDLGRPQ
jgi:uncharacterized protein YkwD